MDILEGYWYCAEGKPGSNFVCDCMQIKSKTNKPPYLVVEKSLQSIILSGDWPGELWRVRILELGDMSGLIANPSYWRANAILLLEQLHLSELFGLYGERVVVLLSQIQSLSTEQADIIASAVNPYSSEAYMRAWEAWNNTLEFPRRTNFERKDYNLLGMPHKQDKAMSPINHGFLLIHDLLRKRARELEGDDAFTLVKDFDSDETETVFTDKWDNISSAFLYAAMALGAPNCVKEEDYEILISAWRSAFPNGLSH